MVKLKALVTAEVIREKLQERFADAIASGSGVSVVA